jgi:Flp pilus assembly protein TadD
MLVPIIMAALLSGCGSLSMPTMPRLKPAEVPVEQPTLTPTAKLKASPVVPDPTPQKPPSPLMLLLKDHQVEAAETLLIAELNRRPDRISAKTNLGLLYANTGRSEQAIAVLDDLVASHPGVCAAQIKLAQLHREAYRFDEAEAAYGECLRHKPTHPAALLNLGILFELYRGDFNAALVQYERYQASTVEPDRRVEGWIADLSRRENQIAEARR